MGCQFESYCATEGFDRWRTVNKGVRQGGQRDTRPTLINVNKGTTGFATPPFFWREEVFYFAKLIVLISCGK